MKALAGAFNQENGLVGADCENQWIVCSTVNNTLTVRTLAGVLDGQVVGHILHDNE